MWSPVGINLLSKNYNGSVLVNMIMTLARELENMQREIDELKRKVDGK